MFEIYGILHAFLEKQRISKCGAAVSTTKTWNLFNSFPIQKYQYGKQTTTNLDTSSALLKTNFLINRTQVMFPYRYIVLWANFRLFFPLLNLLRNRKLFRWTILRVEMSFHYITEMTVKNRYLESCYVNVTSRNYNCDKFDSIFIQSLLF